MIVARVLAALVQTDSTVRCRSWDGIHRRMAATTVSWHKLSSSGQSPSHGGGGRKSLASFSGIVVERNRVVATYPLEISSRVMTFRWHL